MGVHTLMLAGPFSVEWVQPWAKRGVVMLLGVTLVGIGNLLPRTRPNMALGIRTARTLSDRQLWMLTHRMSGYATVAVGVVTLFASVFLQGDQAAAVPAIAFAIAGILLLAGYWKFSRVDASPQHWVSSLAAGPHPHGELTPMLRLGFACPRRRMAAGAPFSYLPALLLASDLLSPRRRMAAGAPFPSLPAPPAYLP